MFDKLKGVITGNERVKLPHELIVERVQQAEARIIANECSAKYRGRKIEDAILIGFRERIATLLGFKEFDGSAIANHIANLYASVSSAGQRKVVRKQFMRDLAANEGVSGEFEGLPDLASAVLIHRVTEVAAREGLDLSLVKKEGLNSALANKHAKELSGEGATERSEKPKEEESTEHAEEPAEEPREEESTKKWPWEKS